LNYVVSPSVKKHILTYTMGQGRCWGHRGAPDNHALCLTV
jgi:hypothetical protein